MKQVEGLEPDRQPQLPGNSDFATSCQDKQIEVASKGGFLGYEHMDGVRQTGMCQGDFVEEGETSFDVATASLEKSHQDLNNATADEETANESIEDVLKYVPVDEEHRVYHGTSNSSLENLSDERSLVFENSKHLGSDLENMDRSLTLLCGLTAVQQEEHDLSAMNSDQVTSELTNLISPRGEPEGLSFVDLLRKQMVQAGSGSPFTDVETHRDELTKQNYATVGSAASKQYVESSGNVSSDGAEAIFEGKPGESGDMNTVILKNASELEKVTVTDGRTSSHAAKEECSFGAGDLVWAKVKSHPWWPGQIFDAADASKAAKRIQRPGRVLVAFFGDGTYGWLQQSQLVAFKPNFEEKVKQTTMKSFCRAVLEALDEVSRRMELGLGCPHFNGDFYGKNTFPDANAGMRKGVRINRHHDISMSRERFQSESVLDFLKAAACSPFYSLDRGPEYAESCGHVNGFRSFMLASGNVKSKYIPQTRMIKYQGKKEAAESSISKKRFRSDEARARARKGQDKEAERPYLIKDTVEKPPSLCSFQSPLRILENHLSTEADEVKAPGGEVNLYKERTGSTWLAKGKRLHVSHEHIGRKRVKGWHLPEDSSVLGVSRGSTDVNDLASRDDDTKTLLDLAGFDSLKKKKKKGGALKVPINTLSVPTSKKGDEQPIEQSQELMTDKPCPEMEMGDEEEGSFTDSGTKKQKDSVSTNTLRVVNEKVDQQPFEQSRELIPDNPKVETGCDGEVSFPDSDSSSLSVLVKPSTSKDAEVSEKVKGKLCGLKESQSPPVHGNDLIKAEKQAKRLHSQEGDSLGMPAKTKKRREVALNKVVMRPAPFPKQEVGDIKGPIKKSKVGASPKEVAAAPKCAHLSMNDETANEPVSDANANLGVEKDAVGLNLDHGTRSNQNSVSAENLANPFVKLLENLQVIARDPSSSANMKSSLLKATSAFLKFRNMVFLKSSGYGSAGFGKLVTSVENDRVLNNKRTEKKVHPGNQNLSPGRQKSYGKDFFHYRNAEAPSAVQDFTSIVKAGAVGEPAVTVKSQQSEGLYMSTTDTETASGETALGVQSAELEIQIPGVQELAVAARNKKSKVLGKSAAKVPIKSEVPKEKKHFLKERLNKAKVIDPRHLSTHVKHHISRAETVSLLGKKSPVQVSSSLTVPQTSLGIIIQFREDFTLPSEAQLKETFDRFGTLETSGIRVSRNASTAQVLFKHSSDAEAAWHHVRNNRMFGDANVSYRLMHFSPSSKNDGAYYTPTSAKNSSSEVTDLKSSLVEDPGRLGHERKSASIGTELEGLLIPDHSPSIISSTSGAEPEVLRRAELSPSRISSPSGAEPEGSIISKHSPSRISSSSRAEPLRSVALPHSPGLQQEKVVHSSSTHSTAVCSSGAKPEGSLVLPHSPVLHQREVVQSPSTHNMALSSTFLSLPSVPSINIPSGDIQDQMMKLLQQVSIIVSSSIPKTA